MEQRIELFSNEEDQRSVQFQGKERSEELFREGWFLHDTCIVHEPAVKQDDGSVWGFEMLMITYRRKA